MHRQYSTWRKYGYFTSVDLYHVPTYFCSKKLNLSVCTYLMPLESVLFASVLNGYKNIVIKISADFLIVNARIGKFPCFQSLVLQTHLSTTDLHLSFRIRI